MHSDKSAEVDTFPVQRATSEEQAAWLAMDKRKADQIAAAKDGGTP